MTRVVVVLLVFTLLSHTQSEAAERVFRVASLARTEDSLLIARRSLRELARLGFREGENLIVEERAGDPSELPEIMKTMLDKQPDAIIALGGEAIRAARESTSSVPIVMFGGPNPVDMGYVASLARPGGNLTGVVILGTELDGKRVDLLHEAVPAMQRIAGLFVPGSPGRQPSEYQMRSVAARIGMDFVSFEAAGPDEYPRAFAGMRSAGVQGVAVMATPLFYRDGAQLAALALQTGVPSVCEWAEMAQVGLSTGLRSGARRTAKASRPSPGANIRGMAAGELPIEQPTHYELGINLRTAKALSLTVPQSLLIRADEVIE